MENIAVVTDSNSGISQKEAKELGVFVIPMPFTIDGNEYYEDINLSKEEFFEKLLNDCQIHTSQPGPEVIMDTWSDILKSYDKIIHIPMSSGLSGACQTAMMLADEEDFEGKVFVVNNQRISVTLKASVLDALRLSKSGLAAEEIKDKLEADKFNSSIYITLDTLNYLKTGGRMTQAVQTLGSILKIKPVLQIQGEKLDAFNVARTMNLAKNQMVNAVKKDIINRFKLSESGKGATIYAVHTANAEACDAFLEELKIIFPEASIYKDSLSLSVSCHIGPGSLALAIVKNME